MSAFSSRTLKSALGGIAVLGVSALILSGCSSTPSASGDSTNGPSGTSTEDLTLSLGTILPQTGTLSQLGPPEIAGVELAVKDINDAGAGLTAEVTQMDSGDTSTDIATQSVTSLLANGVSAIIGAASSSVSLNVIDQITGAEVVQISPANTSQTLSDYDDDGYYFRTAPNDILQGTVLGQKVVGDGATTVAVLYVNNDYGIGLNNVFTSYLEDQGVEVVYDTTFAEGATDFGTAVTDFAATGADAYVVISYEELVGIAEQLAGQGFDFSKLYGVDGNYGYVTTENKNVDIAGAQFTNPGVQAATDFQKRLDDFQSESGGKPLDVYSYAPESYDATVLLALAALQGGATDGPTIRDNMQAVSAGGTECTTFADCAKLIADGEDIDYNGLSGPVTFDDNGDPSQAYVSIYKMTAGNNTEFVDSVYGDLAK